MVLEQNTEETLVDIFQRAMRSENDVSTKDLYLFAILYARNENNARDKFLAFAKTLLINGGEDTLKKYLQVKDQITAYTSRATIFEDMTGLFNKSYFDQQLSLEIGRLKRIVHDSWDDNYKEKPSDYGSVLAIDLVGLKKLNDRFGHKAGDDLIKAVAKKLLEFCQRPGDVCARVGGDEFAILLPRTNIYDAVKIVNRINADFNYTTGLNIDIEVDGITRTIPTRVSIGVTEIKPSMTSDENFKIADRHSYAAKAAQYKILGLDRRG